MKAIEIDNVKKMVEMLLSSDFFGEMLLYKAEVRGAYDISMDGNINPDFFDSDDLAVHEKEISEGYVTWANSRNLFYQALRGKNLPISFNITLIVPKSDNEKILKKYNENIDVSDLSSLSLNVIYDREKMIVTSGTSMKFFTMDRSIEMIWDDIVQNTFNNLEIY